MCTIGAKYINGSWKIFKNRDRNYRPTILIRKSFRKNIERLYVWDDITKYSEGINEYGVAIVSSTLKAKEDEAQGREAIQKPSSDKEIVVKPRTYYCPDGFRIRTALFETSAVEATKTLINLEVPGNTIIADTDRCFLLEGAVLKDQYLYKIKEIRKESPGVVRTNHGIFLPFAGYSNEIESQKQARKSSEVRLDITRTLLSKAQTDDAIWDAISYKDNRDPQMNPLRLDSSSRSSMRTTGQIFISTSEKVIHYRPIWCKTSFNIETLNNKTQKTFFEIISTRKLLSFKDLK